MTRNAHEMFAYEHVRRLGLHPRQQISRALYGVMNNLPKRLAAHRSGEVVTTATYRITRLVYAACTSDIDAAIRRVKQLESWRREKKLRLITAANPAWDDLMPDWEKRN